MIAFFVIGLCSLLQFGVEATIDLSFDDVELVTLDPEYFDPEKTEIFLRENDEGETTFVSTIAVLKKLPDDATAHMQILGLSMGVYKVPTGLYLDMKTCELLDEEVIVGPLLNAFGFFKGACPPDPGVYSQDGYVPRMDLMPKSFVENKYQGIFEIAAGKKVVLGVRVDLEVFM